MFLALLYIPLLMGRFYLVVQLFVAFADTVLRFPWVLSEEESGGDLGNSLGSVRKLQ